MCSFCLTGIGRGLRVRGVVMPTNWKYIKKLLEKEFLCEKLRGHITYDLTNYRPMPWYQQHFIMKYDDEVLLDVSQVEYGWNPQYHGGGSNWGRHVMITEKLYQKYQLDKYGLPRRIAEAAVYDAICEAGKMQAHHEGIFGVHDVIDAIGVYLHSDIEKSLGWGQDDLICALAILDKRCGKRRLKKYADWNYTGFPTWARRICQIRFEAEGIPYNAHYRIKASSA